jgi:predicted PurR-regulated permease PerM
VRVGPDGPRYQWFENHLVQPLVQGRAVSGNPLGTILGVPAGASLLGILGALLAMPVSAAVQIILRDWPANRTAAPEAAWRAAVSLSPECRGLSGSRSAAVPRAP